MNEVLAVGDAAFQRLCLAKEGRTVLFVSHSMVRCQRTTGWHRSQHPAKAS